MMHSFVAVGKIIFVLLRTVQCCASEALVYSSVVWLVIITMVSTFISVVY